MSKYLNYLIFSITFLIYTVGVQASTLNEPGFSEVWLATIPETTASFGSVADASGSIYTTSAYNSEVYKVTSEGTVIQFGTTGGSGNTLGIGIIGNTLFVGFRSGEIRTLDLTQGSPTGVLLASLGSDVAAMGMALAPAGFGAFGGQLVIGTNNGISIVNPSNGAVTVLLATPGNPHSDVAFTPDGELLSTDYDNDRIVSVSAAGVETTFYAGPNGPDGIAVHPGTGDVYVASSGLDAIVKINSAGTSSSEFASDADFDSGWYVSPIRFSTDAAILYYGVGESQMDFYAISGFSGVGSASVNVPIPTMSAWALIVLSALIGLAVFASRRRLIH